MSLMLLALMACSKNPRAIQTFTFKISAQQTGLPINGGSFVRAIKDKTDLLIKLDEKNSAEFEQGIWEFQTLSYEGPATFQGKKYCGRVIGLALAEEKKNVLLTINEANCLSEPFLTLNANINKAFNNVLPAPVVNNITFNTSPLTGGAPVAITGLNFQPGAVVDLGGAPCTSVVVIDSSQLNCTTSSRTAGTVNVSVTNPDLQTGVLPGAFHYRQSFISKWRTTSSNEHVRLPLKSSSNYDFIVDWGDGSAVTHVTTYDDADINHYYLNPGDYTVRLSGLAEGWGFWNTGSLLNIIQVINFGDMGWKDLNGGFYGCTELTSFAGGITNQVTSMYGMFYATDKITSLDVSTFNTDNVTNMAFMFGHTNILPSLNVTNFNTANVTNMDHMFEQAMTITSLNVSNFNTSKVTSMVHMFNNAAALTSLDVSSFDTSSVTNMQSMFANMRGATGIVLGSFNTSLVTDMSHMFEGSSKLSSLDLSGFDTSQVTSMEGMFATYGPPSQLINLNANNWNITNVSNYTNIFSNANGSLAVTCNQGGAPATGTLFGQSCF